MLRCLMACLSALLLSSCGQSPTFAPVQFHADGMPATLSEWNLLRVADGRLQLNEGVLPYDLNTPLFTDYAHKLRTVWMPAGTSAHYTPDTALDFPVGTIISKTFYYPRGENGAVLRNEDKAEGIRDNGLSMTAVRLIETRLLIHRQNGWVALPYVWNEAQTEARLMRGGDIVPLQLVSEDGSARNFEYQIPDQNQCAGCHGVDTKSRAVLPIGPKARHLNRTVTYADGSADQLTHWAAAGYLDGLPDAASRPRDAVWNHDDAPLQARARAYLDINCGHCHNPKGAANTSGMWLDAATVDPLRLGRCKLPIAAGRGTGGLAHGIVPGNADASILAYRMGSEDPSVMMPELGRSTAHEEGVALIRDWIDAMQDVSCDNNPQTKNNDT